MVITRLAQEHFLRLLLGQESGSAVRVFITDVGTSRARCGVCFCLPNFFLESDVVIDFECMSVRVEDHIVPFLKDSIIDVVMNGLGVQLTFKVPYAKGFSDVTAGIEKNLDNDVLEQRIRDVLELRINPQLLVHGGNVSLVNVTEDFLVVLKFSGGCNGCAMSNYTMQLGIETVLKKMFPQLKGVCDVTDHRHGSHSYY